MSFSSGVELVLVLGINITPPQKRVFNLSNLYNYRRKRDIKVFIAHLAVVGEERSEINKYVMSVKDLYVFFVVELSMI